MPYGFYELEMYSTAGRTSLGLTVWHQLIGPSFEPIFLPNANAADMKSSTRSWDLWSICNWPMSIEIQPLFFWAYGYFKVIVNSPSAIFTWHIFTPSSFGQSMGKKIKVYHQSDLLAGQGVKLSGRPQILSPRWGCNECTVGPEVGSGSAGFFGSRPQELGRKKMAPWVFNESRTYLYTHIMYAWANLNFWMSRFTIKICHQPKKPLRRGGFFVTLFPSWLGWQKLQEHLLEGDFYILILPSIPQISVFKAGIPGVK